MQKKKKVSRYLKNIRVPEITLSMWECFNGQNRNFKTNSNKDEAWQCQTAMITGYPMVACSSMVVPLVKVEQQFSL